MAKKKKDKLSVPPDSFTACGCNWALKDRSKSWAEWTTTLPGFVLHADFTDKGCWFTMQGGRWDVTGGHCPTWADALVDLLVQLSKTRGALVQLVGYG